MEAEEEFVGCISCMGTNDLCDLFGAYAANAETYAKMLENCFGLKVCNFYFLHFIVIAIIVYKLFIVLSFFHILIYHFHYVTKLKFINLVFSFM